jgi:hypothetical protein
LSNGGPKGDWGLREFAELYRNYIPNLLASAIYDAASLSQLQTYLTVPQKV